MIRLQRLPKDASSHQSIHAFVGSKTLQPEKVGKNTTLMRICWDYYRINQKLPGTLV
jgi:hypothetical protein